MTKNKKIENFISIYDNVKLLNIIDDCIIIEFDGSGYDASNFSDTFINFLVYDTELKNMFFQIEFK